MQNRSNTPNAKIMSSDHETLHKIDQHPTHHRALGTFPTLTLPVSYALASFLW